MVLIKQENFVTDFRYRAPRPSGLGVAADGVLVQVGKSDYPGCPGAQLLGWKHAGDDHSVGRGAAYLQKTRDLIKHDFAALGTLAFAIDRNTVGFPQTADIGSCPGRAAPRQLT